MRDDDNSSKFTHQTLFLQSPSEQRVQKAERMLLRIRNTSKPSRNLSLESNELKLDVQDQVCNSSQLA